MCVVLLYNYNLIEGIVLNFFSGKLKPYYIILTINSDLQKKTINNNDL